MINYNNPKLHLAVISFVLYILFALVSGQLAVLALSGSILLLLYALIAKNSNLRAILPSFLAQNLDLMIPTLAGILWAVSLWLIDEPQPVMCSVVIITLVAAALICFQDEFESTSGFIITPVLSLFVYLLAVPNESLLLLAFGMLITTGLLYLVTQFKHLIPVDEERSHKSDQLSDSTSAQLDDNDKLLNKIRELSDENKQLEVDISAAEMAKMEFLATMSHEIRTPLNGIVPLIDIVLDSELTEFQKDYLTTAHTSATQMQKLIDDLLDFSKVEAGKMRIELSGLKVKKIMENVRHGLEAMADKKGLDIHINIDSNISPLLRGDPIRLRQVMTNLLSNAIKFSHNGSIEMSAVRLRSEGNHEIVRFSVQDEGIGIDGDNKDELFNAFHQGDNSSTRKFGGTGLGLAISKKIVELLKGTIGVDSEKGKGSTFWFELPLLKSAGETAPEEEKTSEGYQAILINSNPDLFKSIQERLQDVQIKSYNTLNLQQTIERLKTWKNVVSNTKRSIIFVDFDTNAKLFRQLLMMKEQNQLKDVLMCVVSKQSQIAGVKQHEDIHIINKNMSAEEILQPFEEQAEEVEEAQELVVEPIVAPAPPETEEEVDSEPVPLNDRAIDTIDKAVLLVEDNEVNLKVAQKLIDYIGYPFDVARNGMEGLEKVKKRSYRMILMDCQMPIMDGYTCTKRIRDYEKGGEIGRTPIIAMTANAMLGDREKCIAAGMDDYMSKPLNRYILEKTLKKWDPLRSVDKDLSSEPVSVLPTSKTGSSDDDNNFGEQPNDVSGEHEPAASLSSLPSNKAIKKEEITAEKTISTPPPVPRRKVDINNKWLNVESLQKIEAFMGEETDSLLELFKQESPVLLKQMRVQQIQKNYPELQKLAHTLKSTSANIGANGLSFFCKKMEQAAMIEDHAKIIDLHEKIKKSYLLTIREIKKYKM